MKNKIVVVLFVVLLSSVLFCSGFYKNLAEDGKSLYLSGKYIEAVENFKIAEFGLSEKEDVLKEIYLYYSLAHFKLKNGDEVIEITDKLKALSGFTNFMDLKKPDEIRDDLDDMFSVIDSTYVKKIDKVNNQGENVSGDKEKELKSLFEKLRSLLKKNDLNSAESGLKKLRKLGGDDLRVKCIAGIIHFRNNNYKKAMSALLPVSKFGSDRLVGESSYYLALLNYFKKNYGQFLAFHKKVTERSSKDKLIDFKNKVDKIKNSGIMSIKENFFNKKGLKNFIRSFDGDISLASDIFYGVSTLLPVRIRDIYFMSSFIIKYPNVYDSEFILKTSEMLVKEGMEEYAIDILKRSKFFKDKHEENIEVLYNLGMIYSKIGDKKRLKKMMLRVYNINKNYKRVNYYLTN